jgi:hypothetical protein
MVLYIFSATEAASMSQASGSTVVFSTNDQIMTILIKKMPVVTVYEHCRMEHLFIPQS